MLVEEAGRRSQVAVRIRNIIPTTAQFLYVGHGLEVAGKMLVKTIPNQRALTIQQAIVLAHEHHNAGAL